MKITSAIITLMPRPMPEGMFDPMPEVVATFEDGSTKSLFSFYPDEVSFQASEFAGLTEEEARRAPLVRWGGGRPVAAPCGNLGSVVGLGLERAGGRVAARVAAHPVDGSVAADPGLAREERAPSSVAATGFALTAWCIADERGWLPAGSSTPI